jgi:hypothetical protein
MGYARPAVKNQQGNAWCPLPGNPIPDPMPVDGKKTLVFNPENLRIFPENGCLKRVIASS